MHPSMHAHTHTRTLMETKLARNTEVHSCAETAHITAHSLTHTAVLGRRRAHHHLEHP